MTTAARPTFEPARGGSGRNEKDLSAISRQYSSRDLPGHTKLKYRSICKYVDSNVKKVVYYANVESLLRSICKYVDSNVKKVVYYANVESLLREHGQGTQEETRSRDFRRELEDRETQKRAGGSRTTDGHLTNKRLKLDQVPAASLDADDPIDPEEEDSDSSDGEDDTEALLAELNKIKKERAIEQTKKEIERRQEEERIRMENILSGNPLLTHYASSGSKADHKVKRRWDDDVVFKNCAKSEPERNSNVFINDSLRSEFHKKFMEKYVK